MFFISMEDRDKIQDEAWSLIFFISAWLEMKTFAWSGVLYVLLIWVLKKLKKCWGFFWTKSIHVLEIMKCGKLKREAEDFREESMPDKYVTFK